MFGELTGGGRGLRGGARGEKWMGCLVDDLRAFSINADLWKTVANQDEGEWRKTAEQGAESFMAKWIAAEKVRAGLDLRHAVVCPNATGK